jgi:hypothetical protein
MQKHGEHKAQQIAHDETPSNVSKVVQMFFSKVAPKIEGTPALNILAP